MTDSLRLRSLPLLGRLGLTCVLIVLLGGMITAGLHISNHHQNRDERAGLSMDDLIGAYHGIRTRAPLLTALERGHPEDLPEQQSAVLLNWLNSERISEDYDNLDLGMAAPAEIIAQQCLQCHARQATEGDGIGETMPLEYWDDVAGLAFSRNIDPTSVEILTVSTHTHALGIGAVVAVASLLIFLTSWPKRVCGLLVCAAGLGLLLDVGGQWLARLHPVFVYGIVAGGILFGIATVILLLAVIFDLWLPARPQKTSEAGA